MADRGYTMELDQYRQSSLSIELPGVEKAIDNEQTQQILRSQFEQLNQAAFALLADAQCQLIIPIRREERVIGVLLLESVRETPWSLEAQEFLSRLTDHAAIAIANAELFSQVQEANSAKTEFISFVSHELKTPMTSIRGYTDLLLGKAVGDINQAQENFLTTIRTNVTRMATLVSDLADVSRIEAGRFHMEFASLSIEEAVNEVIRSQSYFLQERNQALEVEIPDTLLPAWGDHTRIVQILTNLVSNANKYTPPGGEITITAEQVENRWDPQGAPIMIQVSVKDNGIGMSDEDQAHIFTKFFRSADPKAREVPGTGLGLNITRYLVEMQGGAIWFESEFRAGTTFHFTVPAAQV
jgi:signal transduction histidine kinase